MYIDSNTVIQMASVFTAVCVLGGGIVTIIKWVERQNAQDKEIKHIKNEQTLIYEGIIAILDGLEQQGCNHTVTETRTKLINHLNERAHSTNEES